MAAEDNAKGWFLHSHAQGKKFGPLTEDELRSYFRAGMVKSVDRLSAPGDAALMAAGDVATLLGESVPVGPPPPPEPVPAPRQPSAVPMATRPADAGATGEERAARAAAAMNIDLAALMAGNAPARKKSTWLVPLIAFFVLVIMLFVGLGMLKKMGSGSKPIQTTIEMEQVPPTGSGAGFEETQQPESAARALEAPAGASAPSTDNNSTFVAFMSKAEELKAASNWSALVAHSREWAEAQPDRDEPLQYLAYGYTSAGSYVQAEEALKKILGRHPDSAEARALLADNYLQAQRYDEAVLFYKQAVTATPNDARMWNNYGTALSGAGQKDQAAVALETAVKIDPTLKQAWSNLGNVYRSLGDEPRAAAAFANAR